MDDSTLRPGVEEIGERPGSPDGPEWDDVFHAETAGLWPDDHFWLLRAAVVRDAVSAFEVYLEKASAEVLRRHRLRWSVDPGRSPQWDEVVTFYRKMIKTRVNTPKVRAVRELRHLLTHQRGELRTQHLREEYGDDGVGPVGGYRVGLPEEQVIEILDELAALVRDSVEPALRQFLDGEKSLPLTHSDQIWRMHQIAQKARKRGNTERAVRSAIAAARTAGDGWDIIAEALDLPADEARRHYGDVDR